MNNTEHKYYKYCLSLIEKKLSWLNNSNWKQRDYLSLIDILEEKTGVRLSLSTIKRIWKPDYNGVPHRSTLEAFAVFLDYENWLDFKEKNKHNVFDTKATFPKNRKKSFLSDSQKRFLKKAAIILVLCLSISLLFFIVSKTKQSDINISENVLFSCKKSAQGKIPNSVIFSYNVKDINARKFFIQQDWDKARRIEVSCDNNTQTDIYYTPGFFNAKLFADDEIIKEIPVHITYNDWFIGARQHPTEIIAFEQENWVPEDYLGIQKSAVEESKLDTKKEFQFNIYNSREFNVDGDNFEYSSSFKMERLESHSCLGVSLLIKGEHNLFWISFGNEGCESNLSLNCSNSYFSGKTNDLSAFGVDMYAWQNLKIQVSNKNVLISINGSLIFNCSYEKSIGSLKTINYYFDGLGMIDNVQLLDGEGAVKFEDSFNRE